MHFMYVKKVEVRNFAKARDMRVSGDVYEALDMAIDELLKKAAVRSRDNGRKTIKAIDL